MVRRRTIGSIVKSKILLASFGVSLIGSGITFI